MAENKNNNQDNQNNRQPGEERSIGNQQGTAQTGAQNGGGENIEPKEDQFTDDLRQSGDRNSSNRKQGS
jgi:hypothetical protein